jgi:formylglycine-generating enzyme required for sulfatase activity/tRNA A-37 threonylcarbamoyl transferase component Bud32
MFIWQPGKRLNNGKYVVEDILGSGGFGVTYKVTETRSNRLLAIKTLNPNLQNRSDFRELQVQFVNEAIALARFNHPNIVRVDRVFQEEELWFMVMEYIEGKDLASHLGKHGTLSEPNAIAIITKVGEALSYVHQQNILHRDIKPANILLRQSDLSPVVIDFGLARELISDLILQSMSYFGTPFYAPVEEYEQRGNFGAWTDVYALAATLYVLLVGDAPGLFAHVRKVEYLSNGKDPLSTAKEKNPSISDRVNNAILKGMEIEPQNRPRSTQEWLNLLKPLPIELTETPTQILERNSQEVLNPVSPPQSKQEVQNKNTSLSLKTFEFEVATIAEINTSSGFLGLGKSRSKVIYDRRQSKAQYFTEDLDDGIALDMVAIPGGTFMMGTEEAEIKRLKKKYDRDYFSRESPQHRVTVPDFYMGKFQVTQEQWRRVAQLPRIDRELKENPSEFEGDKLPVESVSWYDAVEFCARLSKSTGKEYRLPSEAEWEYACRAGTTTPFYFGETITTDLANYNGNYAYANEAKGKYRKKTTEVGSFPPNGFGLYDMHGNVWEWCADNYHENYQGAPNNGSAWLDKFGILFVLRGGSWFSYPLNCRSAYRFKRTRGFINLLDGFRCVVSRTS